MPPKKRSAEPGTLMAKRPRRGVREAAVKHEEQNVESIRQSEKHEEETERDERKVAVKDESEEGPDEDKDLEQSDSEDTTESSEDDYVQRTLLLPGEMEVGKVRVVDLSE
ncbi:hypothetical protein HDV00_002000 [Rhizophlyctis rosea]|nr:hypothetical protein HDV00_002000 [Rhizophlyctis rosea]